MLLPPPIDGKVNIVKKSLIAASPEHFVLFCSSLSIKNGIVWILQKTYYFYHFDIVIHFFWLEYYDCNDSKSFYTPLKNLTVVKLSCMCLVVVIFCFGHMSCSGNAVFFHKFVFALLIYGFFHWFFLWYNNLFRAYTHKMFHLCLLPTLDSLPFPVQLLFWRVNTQWWHMNFLW